MTNKFFLLLAGLLFLASYAVASSANKSNRQRGPNTAPRSGGTSSPFQTFLSTIRESRKHLAAAAVARSVSIIGMYPVDTIKVHNFIFILKRGVI
jgi:hypothetical protein